MSACRSMSSQRLPGWLKKRQNDNTTLIPLVVLQWTATKSILQVTTSSPVWVLAAGVSRLLRFATVKSWALHFPYCSVHRGAKAVGCSGNQWLIGTNIELKSYSYNSCGLNCRSSAIFPQTPYAPHFKLFCSVKTGLLWTRVSSSL